MKKTYSALALMAFLFALTSTKRDPSNPPTGNTGAPGETTCQKTDCHSGGNFAGTVELTGVPDNIAANTTYTVTVTHTSGATKAGFQLTCLDKNNAKCGTLTSATGVSVTTASSRQYARQSAAKTLSGGTASWSFKWKSPATLPADSITFYMASIAADGNDKNTNDNVLVGSKKVSTSTATATGTADEKPFGKIYPTLVADRLTVELDGAARAELVIFDQNGRAVARQTVSGGRQEMSAAGLPTGVLTAKLTAADGRNLTARLVKN